MSTGKIIFGGSFNPLHIGHLRLAMECIWWMRDLCSSLDFLPSYQPPHKRAQPILPFWLRRRLIEEAIRPIRGFSCSSVEESRGGLSWTYETLELYKRANPGQELYFLLGSEDLPALPQWHYGLLLPSLCNLVVVPRGVADAELFCRTVRELWPAATPDPEAAARVAANAAGMRMLSGTFVYWLPVPWLDIRASHIRQLWLAGRDIRYLVTEDTRRTLDNQAELVRRSWQEKQCST